MLVQCVSLGGRRATHAIPLRFPKKHNSRSKDSFQAASNVEPNRRNGEKKEIVNQPESTLSIGNVRLCATVQSSKFNSTAFDLATRSSKHPNNVVKIQHFLQSGDVHRYRPASGERFGHSFRLGGQAVNSPVDNALKPRKSKTAIIPSQSARFVRWGRNRKFIDRVDRRSLQTQHGPLGREESD